MATHTLELERAAPAAPRPAVGAEVARHTPRTAEIGIDAARATRWLVAAAFALGAAGMAEQAARRLLDLGYRYPLFVLNSEQNVPTWFQSAVLLAGGACGALVALAEPRRRTRLLWLGLAGLLVLMSLDEVAVLHEKTIRPLRAVLPFGGVLYYPWVVLGLALLAVLTVLYWRFFRGLPPRTRRVLLLGAGLLFGGAVGVEMVGAYALDTAGAVPAIGAAGEAGDDALAKSTAVLAFENLEELLEMTGAIVLLRGLLDHLGRHHGRVSLSIGGGR